MMHERDSGLVTAQPGDVDMLMRFLQRDLWAGSVILRGQLPRVPVYSVLPTAAANYAYQLITISGTPDVCYQCLRNAGGTWGWRTVATG